MTSAIETPVSSPDSLEVRNVNLEEKDVKGRGGGRERGTLGGACHIELLTVVYGVSNLAYHGRGCSCHRPVLILDQLSAKVVLLDDGDKVVERSDGDDVLVLIKDNGAVVAYVARLSVRRTPREHPVVYVTRALACHQGRLVHPEAGEEPNQKEKTRGRGPGLIK